MKLTFIFLLLSLLFALSPLRYAQKYDQHITLKRGDYKEFVFKHSGNVSSSDIAFVAKLTKSFSSPRLIQKANDDTTEISTIYSSPYTYIRVKLLQSDTRDFTSAKYFYDIVADSTTIFDGELRIQQDVQTPFDGVDPPTNGSRFYVAGTFIDTTVADGSVFVWDSSAQTLSAISKDSLWQFLNVSDTVDAKIAEEMLDFKNYSLTFLYPTTNEDVLIDRTHRILTIDSIFCSTKDSSIAFNIYYASTRNGSTTGVFSSNQTITTATTLTSFANATIPANRYLILQFSTVAGLLSEEFYIKIYYRF